MEFLVSPRRQFCEKSFVQRSFVLTSLQRVVIASIVSGKVNSLSPIIIRRSAQVSKTFLLHWSFFFGGAASTASQLPRQTMATVAVSCI
ncbi:hypothetical protein TYRP_012074 [Tyrophagus putrescentiae]|nr:hypothetical protein TYRP_012074 [Tyrophagus putrescentiae]